MSKNEYDWNEETFTVLQEPQVKFEPTVLRRHGLKKPVWNTAFEIVVLVLILTFGAGVFFTSEEVDREKTVSIEEKA